jgi:Terminase large subunit, T4likevirus-type, N-terminal
LIDLIQDLNLAVDRVAFAEAAALESVDDWQRDLLSSSASRVLLNCSRQSGKSTMAGLLALHRAIYFPSSLVLLLAPALRQSQELYAKVSEFYQRLPDPIPTKSYTALTLTLENGSRIISLPGNEKHLRGYSGVDLLIVDEAARVLDELYYSVRPMLAVSGGRLLMLSTPYGKRGVFYEEWTGGTGWERYTVTAEECPRISRAFLEEERSSLGPWWFEQEYHCEFKDTIDALFREADIQAAFDNDLQPLFPEGEVA